MKTDRFCRRCGAEEDVMHAFTVSARLLQHPQQFTRMQGADRFWLCMSCETDYQQFLRNCEVLSTPGISEVPACNCPASSLFSGSVGRDCPVHA